MVSIDDVGGIHKVLNMTCDKIGRYRLKDYGVDLSIEIHPRIVGTCVTTRVNVVIPYGAIPTLPGSIKETIHNTNKDIEFPDGIPAYVMNFTVGIGDELISKGGYVVWDDPEKDCPEEIRSDMKEIKKLMTKEGYGPNDVLTFEDNIAINIFMFSEAMEKREMEKGQPFAMMGLRNLTVTSVMMLCEPGKTFGGIRPEQVGYTTVKGKEEPADYDEEEVNE